MEARRKAFSGALVMALDVGGLVESGLAYLLPQGVNIAVFDESLRSGAKPLYWHRSRRDTSGAEWRSSLADPMRYAKPLGVAGQRWRIVCTPARPYLGETQSWRTWALLAGLLMATAFGAAYIRLASTRERHARQMVLQRTLELRESNRTLRIEARDRREAERVALAASKAKTEFLANVSHELRTPMNGILGLLDLVSESGNLSAQRETIDLVRASAKTLQTIVDDILDMSRIEAGTIRITKEPFVLPEILEALAKTFRLEASKTGVTFECRMDVPRYVIGDAGRLRQVLTNLLSNAIKFTPLGSITLTARPLQIADNVANIRFEVEDTGVGISPTAQTKLFRPFSQADSSLTRQYSGTGLGLAICKSIVEVMGGSIGLKSQVGEGSVFWFDLPMPLAAPPPEVSTNAVDSERAAVSPERILVVEDNPINVKVITGLAKKLGYQSDVAVNGQEALRLWEANEYLAILMDCQMPLLDGYEATREIRRRENGVHIPIVGVTAHAMAGDRQRCLDAGMDEYVTKPVSLASLHTALERALAQTASCS
jgi:signal transduction histidine kinase/ActR/RegA family two-component response regulator